MLRMESENLSSGWIYKSRFVLFFFTTFFVSSKKTSLYVGQSMICSWWTQQEDNQNRLWYWKICVCDQKYAWNADMWLLNI